MLARICCALQGGILEDGWDYKDHFTCDIDAELRSAHPPTTEAIVTLYMMLGTEFMVSLLRRNSTFRGAMTLIRISRDPFHPMYCRVKRAFEFAQERRTLAGFSRDSWPMTFAASSHNVSRDRRRLVWEPVIQQIKEAWKMYHRFMREGYRPYSVDDQGNALVPVNTFDPRAGELMFQEIQDDIA